MNDYRKTVAVDPDAAYWHVELGSDSSYPFPSLRAAYKFALEHKRADPQRLVIVRFPDGSSKEIFHTPYPE